MPSEVSRQRTKRPRPEDVTKPSARNSFINRHACVRSSWVISRKSELVKGPFFKAVRTRPFKFSCVNRLSTW